MGSCPAGESRTRAPVATKPRLSPQAGDGVSDPHWEEKLLRIGRLYLQGHAAQVTSQGTQVLLDAEDRLLEEIWKPSDLSSN